MLATSLRLGSDPLRTHGVGRFGQVTNGRTGLFANPVGQGQQARCIGSVRSSVAQQHGFALTADQ